MKRESVSISGVGLACSLGMDVSNACAAARAGIVRSAELKCMNFGGLGQFGRETVDGVPGFFGHPSLINPGFTGRARLAALGVSGLQDLLSQINLSREDWISCGFYLNVSDKFLMRAYEMDPTFEKIVFENLKPNGKDELEAAELQKVLPARLRVPINSAYYRLCFGGHAGLVAALDEASSSILTGQLRRCLVGCIDSCITPDFLFAAASARMLKTSDYPVGFSPGEAACFALLETSDEARRRGRKPLAAVTGLSLGEDQTNALSQEPALGRGIENVVRAALSNAAIPGSPAFLILDLNGTERRAGDWGHALVRLRREYPMGNLPLWLPAASFGETGAAAGGLALAMATQAFKRGYAPGESALIALSSESQTRGAFILSSLMN